MKGRRRFLVARSTQFCACRFAVSLPPADCRIIALPMNVFAEVDAEQYDRARPFFHPYVYERLASSWDRRLGRSLDVACGTGQSAEALLPYVSEVIAVDSSAAMCASVPLVGGGWRVA